MRALFVVLGGLAGALIAALFGLDSVQVRTGAATAEGWSGPWRIAVAGLVIGSIVAVGGIFYLDEERLEKGVRWLVVAVVALAIGAAGVLATA